MKVILSVPDEGYSTNASWGTKLDIYFILVLVINIAVIPFT